MRALDIRITSFSRFDQHFQEIVHIPKPTTRIQIADRHSEDRRIACELANKCLHCIAIVAILEEGARPVDAEAS